MSTKPIPRNMPTNRAARMWRIFHSSPRSRRRLGSSDRPPDQHADRHERRVLERVHERVAHAPPRRRRRSARCRARARRSAARPAAGGGSGSARAASAGAGQRHERRAGQEEHQHRVAQPGEQERRREVGDQQVLGHVRSTAGRRRPASTGASSPIDPQRHRRSCHHGCLEPRHRHAPPAQDAQRAQVQRAAARRHRARRSRIAMALSVATLEDRAAQQHEPPRSATATTTT